MSIYPSGVKSKAKDSGLSDDKSWLFSDANLVSDLIEDTQLDISVIEADLIDVNIDILNIEQDITDLQSKAVYTPLEVTISRDLLPTDAYKSLWFNGVGSLVEVTINSSTFEVGQDLEVHVGDSDGFVFIEGAGVNLIGSIVGSNTAGDTVGLRRLADNSFGLTGEVWKVI